MDNPVVVAVVGNTFVVVVDYLADNKAVGDSWVVVGDKNFVHCHQGSTDQYCSFYEVVVGLVEACSHSPLEAEGSHPYWVAVAVGIQIWLCCLAMHGQDSQREQALARIRLDIEALGSPYYPDYHHIS